MKKLLIVLLGLTSLMFTPMAVAVNINLQLEPVVSLIVQDDRLYITLADLNRLTMGLLRANPKLLISRFLQNTVLGPLI